ncbi:MAG TPA: hypothetical protein PKD51_05820 [Saprospiraceae bacterium]|nr:hypothetical protein [Saprospiraceae bacterium]
MNRPVWTIIGFVMFAVGILSVILALVGLKFTFLNFIYNHGVITLVIQLFLLFGGMIILYVSRTSEEEQEEG